MSTKNRGDRIQLLQKVVTKHFTPVPAAEDRSLLEQLIYACCLEDVAYDAADEAFHRLQESFFDWNEVRVTTVSELCETLHNLPEPAAAAMRIKKNLQSLFETRYSFDIDDMAKLNQGKAIAELEKLAGMTKFVLGYMTQNAFGGHAIPISNSILQVLLSTEIISQAEADKGQAPGLERTIAKTKGLAFASCLHQLAVAYATAPGNKQTKAIMKEAGAVEPKKEPPPPAAPSKGAKNQKAPATKTATSSKPHDQKTTGKKPVAKKTTAGNAAAKPIAKSTSNKPTSNKPTSNKPASKSPAKASNKNTTSKKTSSKKSPAKTSPPKRSTKRKPR